MVTITVGYVAGFIAAAIFVSRIWAPMVITFILSGVLGERNNAATWTVAARALEGTYWPDILRSDIVQHEIHVPSPMNVRQQLITKQFEAAPN